MQTILVIGCGAIAEAVARFLAQQQAVRIGAALVTPGRESRARDVFGDDVEIACAVEDVAIELDLAADCAGHAALGQHGEAILSRGVDLVTVSSGALANADLYDRLAAAAERGGSQLRVVPGAIGALDALAAANIGALTQVTYRGRKPPSGWRGSPARG